MVYNFNNKTITIPDIELNNLMAKLNIDENEAIQLWLEDNDYTVSDEYQAALDKAKGFKIDHGTTGTKHKEHKPVKRKVSDEKKEVFSHILAGLGDLDYNVEKDNKLIIVRMGEKIFKIDLIEQRPPKNGK